MRNFAKLKAVQTYRKRILLTVLLLCLFAVVVWFAEINRPFDNRLSDHLVRKIQESCFPNKTVLVHFDGEPTSHEQRVPDLRILSGGVNLHPESSVFNPSLIAAVLRLHGNALRPPVRIANDDNGGPPKLVRNLEGLLPIRERTFADVVYRSGRCDSKREKMVGTIRRIVEAAGFKFAVCLHVCH